MNRHDRLAVALLLLVPTLLFGDVLLGFNNLAERDLTRYYYPTKQIYRQIIAGGEFPLWNRYFHAGQPLAANPEHEIFYPFTWLLMLPNFDLGFRLHILVHLYIAILGMFAFLRSLPLATTAAFFGAVAWAAGGTYLSYVNLLPILFCAAWLPLTAMFVRRFLLYRQSRDFALAALFLGLQFLVAEPTTIVQTGFLIGMYGLYRGWRAQNRVMEMARNTAWIALISAAGFAVGAVQMLAAIDHAGDSVRARPFTFELVSSWSMHWTRLIELVYPHFLGHLGSFRLYFADAFYEPRYGPFVFSIYPGLAATALVVAAVVARMRGSWLVVMLFAISVLLALGHYTPLLRMLYDLGVAASVRYPEKFILFGMFAVTVLAAKAFDRAAGGDERIRRAAAVFALASAIVAAAVTLLGFTTWSIDAWAHFFRLPPDEEKTYAMVGQAWTDWSIAAARGLVLFLLLLMMRTPRRAVWHTAALAFLCADLLRVVYFLNLRLPVSSFTTPAVTAQWFPPNRSEYRIFNEAEWFPNAEPSRKFFAPGPNSYWTLKNAMLPPEPAAYGIQSVLERDFDETSLLPTRDFTNAVWAFRKAGTPDPWRPVMAMSNAWFRGVFRDFDEEMRRTGGDVTQMFPVAFIELAHHPRYYFAERVVQIADKTDFVRRLIRNEQTGRVAFISGKPFKPAAGTVLGARERANSAVIDVETSGRAFLVMSVTPHKYWRVTIDGAPAEAIVTNIGYQGVVVPSGRHRIAMRYRNDMIAVGAPVSAVALLVLTLIAICNRVPGRRAVAAG